MKEFRRLTVLEDRHAALETCGYCPKLCRAACPVSEAEGREPLIPWGKMTMTWYAARGDLEPDRELAALPWACTGCFACRERCEHKNPVVPTLLAARAGYRAEGLAPHGSEAKLAELHARRKGLRSKARGLEGSRASAGQALLIGCGYLTGRGSEAADAVRAARNLCGAVRVLEGCCGASFREAGDPDTAARERQALLAEAAGRPIAVADSGCALELADAGAEPLAQVAARKAEHLRPVRGLGSPVRWHDPCRLSRGLGVVEEPRVVLERALGRRPDEFDRRGLSGVCSGAGGLLPFSMKRTARTIARARLAEHERLGGGTVVTACAASLHWFRAQGARVLDLATVIARSTGGG